MEQTQLESVILATLKQDMNSLHSLLKTQLDPCILSTRLYDATIKGDVSCLHNLLCEDPFILDRCIIEKSDRFMQSPLHVASTLGHLDFTTELLRLKPDLASQLVQSTRASALHLASEKGHLDVVKKLLEVMPNMCFSRDHDGQNPVHLADINNQLHVLDFLVRMYPRAARERTNADETILHLCVKYNQLEPLKYSMNAIGELLNAKDQDGNTVLHLAVVANQPEVVKLLLANKKIQQNAINKDGLAAIDCLIQTGMNKKDSEIGRMLKRAKARKAKHVEKQKNTDEEWLNKQRNALMVVASLIATMAFQFGVNPNWKENSNPDLQYDGMIELVILPSEIIFVHANFYNLMLFNTISLISSFSVVLLLIGGLPCKRLKRHSVIILMVTMGIAITSTLVTYLISLKNPSNPLSTGGDLDNLTTVSVVWGILIGILLLGHILRVLVKVAKILVQHVKKLLCKSVVHSDPVIGSTSLSIIYKEYNITIIV